MSGNRTFRQSMSWLHGWAGLLLGWLLFAIFLTGTLTVFDKEISWWMQPELRDTGVDQPKAARFAQYWLAREHGEAAVWSIDLPTERSPVLKVSTGEDRHAERLVLDPQTGAGVPVRDSVGGNFFFRFHYSLHLPRTLGIWLVGLAAMAMLVALVSGIVIHRHLFRDFFAFRPAGSRRAWLDGHNASAVLLLPFHLMITYTGLVIFFLIYMPAALDALYGGDRMAMLREAPPAELLPLEAFIAPAEALFGPGMVASLRVRHPGRANARVEASPLLGSRIALTKGDAAVFDGVSGKLLQAPAETRPSALTQRVMAGLHFAQFGGYPMRWLYFLCSAVSCAMIASGLVLFVIRQRLKVAEANAGQGFLRLVETLNVGTLAGLMLGCVALLWAARLLPADLPGRAGWEARLFFAVWALAFVHAWRRPPMAAWREQLWAAALLCVGLPLLGGFSAPSLDKTRLFLELCVFLCGALLGWVAWRVGRADAADGVSRPLPGAVRC
ncbi:PepSY domain-containing protein [Azotobacter chroococcum]|uniref:PepSY-associated TM helix domain-containing protein n=1 Tax=Azotobacter chroococcum TaxID=353 RepID=UPI001038BBF5|nr:PepSY-associated TM helix domain-containing protein [Azotobacter chroococcum]TBW08580.1 PepSY domain-containing protein [Azotobacter chroococcum]